MLYTDLFGKDSAILHQAPRLSLLDSSVHIVSINSFNWIPSYKQYVLILSFKTLISRVENGPITWWAFSFSFHFLWLSMRASFSALAIGSGITSLFGSNLTLLITFSYFLTSLFFKGIFLILDNNFCNFSLCFCDSSSNSSLSKSLSD